LVHTVGRRIVICALVSALPAALADAPAPAASCVAAVVVDGRLLLGHGNIAAAHLPGVAEERRAIAPACNDETDDEDDRTISVLTLDGVPPEVAVLRRGGPTELYVAEGSLVVSSAHPLHRAVYRRTSRRSGRRRTCRREPRAVRGTLADDSMGTGRTLALRSGRRTIVIVADARTRLTNRPAYEPLNPGQRLAIRTSICGSLRVADTIAFDGGTVPPEPVETNTGGGTELDPRWMVALAFVAAIFALLLAARRLGRDAR
jgi:hypothetical protein